jgi:beta-barrel assembly-enhancing protease
MTKSLSNPFSTTRREFQSEPKAGRGLYGQAIRRVLWLGILVSFSLVAAFADRRHHDVENIGQRDINGRILGIFPNFVSLEREIELGAQLAQMMEQTLRLVDDPVVNEYIDNLGQHIVKHSDAKVPFVIKVIDTDEVNAFALPGGYFYVNKGLILEADTEAELAGVMAHEIAHVTARHATERMTKSQLLQFASIPALFVGGYWAQAGIQNGLGLGMNLAVLGITRKSEEEADQLGTQYLWNAGLDPKGFVTFFEKLEARERDKPGKFAGFWRTHPPAERRIEKVQEEIAHLPPKDEYRLNTSDFERVKARLAAFDGMRPESGGAEEGARRPTLKRKTGTDRQERGEPTLEGDEPNGKNEKLSLKRDAGSSLLPASRRRANPGSASPSRPDRR